MKKRRKRNINNENTSKKKRKKFKWKKLLKLFINLCLLFLLFALIGSIVFAIYIVTNAPKFTPENLFSTESSVILDKDGNQVAKLGVEKRKNVDYKDLPNILVDAIIATEDSRYMQHNGFDLPRFLKASAGQVISKLRHRGNPGGGSTLDMQVVKNRYTSTEASGVEGIKRKFTDIYISIFKLEKKYSKEEIMEFYVNIPFLGNNAYGVEQACQSYFGKSVSDINLSEAAVIAGLFQAPTSYDPYRHPEAAEERRETVLYLMQRHGYITEEEKKIANSIPVKSLLRQSNPESDQNAYQSYINIVIDEVEKKTGSNPYTTGMKIYTNLDTGKQNVLSDIMAGRTWAWKDDKVQGGIAIVDVNTGALIAVGGGRNQNGERVLNYASDIKRQIGSCAKPLFDYGPAFEYMGASEASQVVDAPHTYSSGVAIKNASGGYAGLLTYKQALANSLNIPALKVFQKNDNAKVKEFVTNLGITPEIDSNGYLHEAHALGAFTGSNPVELAGAYAAFSNGGYYAKPYTITKVEYIDTGKTVSLKSKRNRVMSDSTAFMITDTLKYAVEGVRNIYGTVPGVSLAAKTGTSNFSTEARRKYGYPSSANMDMWVTGYTPDYAVSLWYGYAEAEPGYYLASEGYRTRGELFRQVISSIQERNGKTFPVPGSVVRATIERETFPSLLPSGNTPGDMRVTEYFKKGTVPTQVSPRYSTLPNASGINVKENGNNLEITWNAVAKPAHLTDDAIRKSLKELYPKTLEDALAARKAADGEFGYEVFARDNVTGSEKSLGFTTGTSMKTTKQINTTTYIVKTSMSNLKLTQSSGISIDVKGTGKPDTDDSDSGDKDDTSLINPQLNGNLTDTIKVGNTYADPGVKLLENGIEVASDKITKITVTCVDSAGNNKGTKGNRENYTFDEKGTYKLNYSIVYKGQTYSASRTIEVTE